MCHVALHPSVHGVVGRMSRRVVGVSIAVLVVGGVSGSLLEAADCWRPPVAGTVVDPFREPTCPWCPGNRGLEYRVGRRAPVVAAVGGDVVFAGSVAGIRYVVVAIDGGRRVTYGRLTDISVGVGDTVAVGYRIGVASGDFFFGVRDGDGYADPAPSIGRWTSRPRLVPIDGTPPRAVAADRLVCPRIGVGSGAAAR